MATTQIILNLTARTSVFSIVDGGGVDPIFSYAAGRVTGAARGAGSILFEVFTQLHAETQRWIETVNATCSPPPDGGVALEFEIRRDEAAGTVAARWEVGDPKPLKNNLGYAKAPDAIAIAARPAIDIDWRSFVQHESFVEQFRVACKSF